MPSELDALKIRKTLGREWLPPREWGDGGWLFQRKDRSAAIIVSYADFDDVCWVHASMSRPDSLPTYDDLAMMRSAIFQDGWSYQIFAPPDDHVNIHEYCLHLWGRLDGRPVLPEFHLVNGMI